MRAVLRALRASGIGAAPTGAPLELQSRGDDPPRLEPVTPLEGERLAVRAVPGAPVVGIRAFLDGIQRSQVVAHAGTVPLVHGAVAAAVRVRAARRPRTWDAPRRREALLLPAAALPPALVAALAAQVPLVDTTAGEGVGRAGAHPQDLTARALTAVQRLREAEELALVAGWVADGDGPLLVDGGIGASPEGARDPRVIGVVKSHRTLYAPEGAVPLVLGLREGERTSAVALHSPRRNPVASFYLRLRDAAGRAPLFGLVRVEIAPVGDLTARADEVARWLLAERTPVSLPDARWDVMVYGIRECEQYLTAILR